MARKPRPPVPDELLYSFVTREHAKAHNLSFAEAQEMLEICEEIITTGLDAVEMTEAQRDHLTHWLGHKTGLDL
jgi:hypothetical protein